MITVCIPEVRDIGTADTGPHPKGSRSRRILDSIW